MRKFTAAKDVLTAAPILSLIPTDLLVCVLMQAHKDLALSYSSKAMTAHGILSKLGLISSLARYAVIELDMLQYAGLYRNASSS